MATLLTYICLKLDKPNLIMLTIPFGLSLDFGIMFYLMGPKL